MPHPLCDQFNIPQKFFSVKCSLPTDPQKFSSSKVSHYTVILYSICTYARKISCIPFVVDFDIALLVVVAFPTVFLAGAAAVALVVMVPATFPLDLAVPATFGALPTPLVVPELFLITTDVVDFALVLVVSVMVVMVAVVLFGGGGEMEDSIFARFTAGPFCGKRYQCAQLNYVRK